MSPVDILVLGGLIAAVVCAVVWIVRRKKAGCSGCGCCPYRDNCKK